MGATGSTAIPMSEIDVDSYDGPRFADVVPGTRESGRGPIYVTKRVALELAEQTLYHNFQRGLALDHGQRPCYGTRVVVDGKPGSYEWITYNQVQARVEAIAAGLTQFAGLKRGSFVGIFSKNRVEWCLASHACDRQTYPLVPLYDTLGPEAIPFIVNQTELTTLLCAKEQFDAVLKCKDTCPTLHYVVQYETVTPEQHRLAEEKGFQLKSLGEIQDIGRSNPIRPDAPRPEDIATICYTSGTTGNPKGVILLHKNMTAFAALVEDRVGIYQGSVHMSYLPLAHVFERTLINVLTRVGACSGFYCGDVLTLLDDVAALKPTIFISVPRLFNRIYDKITQGVNAAGGLRKLLFDQAYAAKKAGIPTGHKTHALWDKLVFAKVRMVLGGRVTQVVSASAPLSGEVKEFLRIVFSCDVLEGYGLSETAAGLTLSSGSMPVGPHVGPPIGNMEVRLVDVPEMGYTSNDKPRPRGEVVCRGETVFAGYFKEPEKTAEVFDKDGWFHTGDIGCWNADGTLSIIDRKKNIFKLSQGEYVAAEKIEGIYQKSKYVAQIFVYGDSFQSVLVAVAVPDPEIAEAWGASKGRSKAESTVAALAKDPEFQKEVLADMNRVGKAAELRGFEFVKKIHLEAEPFSVDAGLITPTFKLKRPQLKVHYQAKIDEMYASLSTLGRP